MINRRLVPALAASGLALSLSLQACAPLAIGAGAAAVGVGVAQERSFGDGVDDIAIRTKVRSAFIGDPNSYPDIDVNSVEGRVLLTGTVSNDEARRQAVQLAWKVDDVAEVIDEIVVGERTSAYEGGADARIETALRSRLVADRKIPNLNYIIIVSQGAVHLMGLAADEAELSRVTEQARTVAGVKKVVSHVQFKSDPARRMR
ncbi:MAG: BON domain-containing protein [Pseudomonadota bacterium]